MKYKLKLKSLLTVAVVTLSSQGLFAQNNGKSIINGFIQNWLAPLVILILIGVLIRAYIQNAELIADKGENGTLWKGITNIAIQLVVALFAIAIIGGAVVAVKAFMSTLSV